MPEINMKTNTEIIFLEQKYLWVYWLPKLFNSKNSPHLEENTHRNWGHYENPAIPELVRWAEFLVGRMLVPEYHVDNAQPQDGAQQAQQVESVLAHPAKMYWKILLYFRNDNLIFQMGLRLSEICILNNGFYISCLLISRCALMM